MNKIIKVLIAEDMISLRNQYAKQLSLSPDIEVVSLVENGYEAISNTALYNPDIILMDIEMESKYAGLIATQEIMNSFPNVKIIMLTVSAEDESIFTAFRVGAYNYILKNASEKDLIKCVKDTYYDRAVFDAIVSKKIRTEFKRIKNNEENILATISLIQTLTDSERNIVYNFHLGISKNKLCDKLNIEKSTIKTHIRNIKKKLHCHSIDDAVSTIEKSGYFYYYDKLKHQ